MSSERRKSRTVYVLRWSRPMRSASARLTPAARPHDPLGGHAPLLLLLLPAANLRSVRGLAALAPPGPAVAPGEHGSWVYRGGHFPGPRVWGAPARSAAREGSREPSAEAPGARTAPGMNATALMFYFNARSPFAARLRVTSLNQVKRAKLG